MTGGEGYDRKTAASYAAVRQAVAADLLVGSIYTHGRAAVHDTDLVDAGCGVGLYTAALAPLVRSVSAFDISSPMLARAATAVAELPPAVGATVSLVEADIRHIPLADESADVVLASLVLHHVARAAQTRDAVVEALGECHRVLRGRGLLITVTCTPAQVRDGAWYCALIPRCVEKSLWRHGSVEEQEAEAQAAGFRLVGRAVPVDALLHGHSYFNPLGPLDPEWRRSDSIFTLADPSDISEMEASLNHLIQEGELDDWFRARERRRREVGQITVSSYVRTEE